MDVPTEFQTLGGWTYLSIARYLRRIRNKERAVRIGYAPEDVRMLRGAIRRLRVMLEAFSPAIRLPERSDASTLRDCAAALGELRDLDMMLAALERGNSPFVPEHERDMAEMLASHVRHQRHRPLGRVERRLDGKSFRLVMRFLEEWIADPDFQTAASLPVTSTIPDLLLPLLSSLWFHPGWYISGEITEGKTLSRKEQRRLHDLRRSIRRIRYLVEIFLPFYPPTINRFLDDLIAMQKALGDIQDDTLLPAYIADHFGVTVAEALPGFALREQESRNAALRAWERLRLQYLSPACRHRVRVELLYPNLPAELPKPYRKILKLMMHHAPAEAERSA